MDLFSALRDAEGDLARWTRSLFRPLLDRAAAVVDAESWKSRRSWAGANRLLNSFQEISDEPFQRRRDFHHEIFGI